MVGSAVGGYVDPTQVYGPRLKDVRGQSSAVGGAIPRAWGTAPVPGNIIWQQENPPVTEHKHTDDGKGSGQEQVTYTYTRSYAVMYHIGEISGVIQVKRNSKIVYDARDDATLIALYEASGMSVASANQRLAEQRAENVKWLEKCTFYNGTQTQSPDPTIEAYLGAGNVPAYRGRAYFVVTDDDTQAGEIAQFEIVVSQGIVTPSVVEGALSAGRVADFINEDWPLAGDESDYEYLGYLGMHDASSTQTYSADTIQEIIDYFTTFDYSPHGGGSRNPSVYIGYSAGPYPGTGTIPGVGLDIDYHGVNRAVAQPDVTDNYGLTLVYNDFDADSWLTTVAVSGQCSIIGSATIGTRRGSVAKAFAADPGGQYGLFENCSGDDIYGLYPLCIRVTRKRIGPAGGAPEGGVAMPDAPGYYYVPGTGVVSAISYAPVTGTFKILSPSRHMPPVGGDRDLYTNYELNPCVESGDPLYTDQPFWTAAYNAAVAAGDMPSGYTYSPSGTTGVTTYPWVVTDVWRAESLTYDTIESDAVTIGEIIGDICALSGLASDEYDVSQLTDTVDGYVIARETDGGGVVESLRPVGMFDPGEWDKELRFIKRGGVSVAAFNSDDLVERDGDTFERELVQEVELLRKVTAGYLDPAANWAPNTQIWERRVGTIDARGESITEITAVMGADQAATIAKRKGFVAWGEPEKQKFSLPYRLAALTATDVVSYTDANSSVEYIRVMQIDDDSGVRLMEAATNCAEAYNTVSTGIAPRPPTVTDSSLRGPTNLVVMNLPIWRDGDADDVGLYAAAAGFLPGWSGAQVDISIDGGTTYTRQIQMVDQATIGYTMTDLDAWLSSENPEDQEVTVYLPDAPSSVTYEVMLTYFNRAAMLLDDGSWEILQYQTVTALGDDLYTLSGLVRGRYATTPGVASSGATFVLLNNNVQFVTVPRDLIGETLTIRATTYGTSSDAAVPFDFDFTQSVSQTEWPVHNVDAVRDSSGDIEVSCIIRDRLGTEVTRYPSVHFAGLRFSYSDGVDTVSYDVSNVSIGSSSFGTHEYTLAQQLADFGAMASGGITVTIAPLNDITGAGPASAGVTV